MPTTTEFMLDLLKKTEFATGADFSKWKGSWRVTDENLPLLKLVMDFMIFRVGYGAQNGKVYEDIRFRENYAQGIKYFPRAIRGGYWYFSSHVSWRTQLDFFVSIIDELDIPILVLDFESGYNTKSQAFALAGLYFLRELRKLYPDRKIMLYCNKYTYDDWLSPFTDGYKDFPYWIAQYPWKTWLESLTDWFKNFWTETILKGERKPNLPRTRKGDDQWDIWQFIAASAIGNELGFDSDELDFNQSRLSKIAFREWVLGDEDAEEEDEPDDSSGGFPDGIDIADFMAIQAGLQAVSDDLEAVMSDFEHLLEDIN